MDSKLRKMAILASMAVILLVALLVMYVNREQFTAASGPPASGTQNAGAGDSASPAENGVQAEETVSPDGQIGNDLKAFLKDNTFFDQEVNPILEAAKDNSNRLSLVATSIEKDLRIQIVDNEGIPVTGESFYVRLDGLGDYKDLDQDGIIYIGDLDSGDYYIELLPIEGYKVPVSETRVHVKDKVEYLAIDDISLLIKTEDEVDAEAEDSAVADALADASAVIELIRDYRLNYPVFIDTEGAGGNGRADNLDAETRTLVCEAFCRTIENAGYTAGVYASRNWYNNNLQTARLENYHIWLAEYRSVPLYQGYYKTWQYTSKGKVDGIEGRVDMNITYE